MKNKFLIIITLLFFPLFSSTAFGADLNICSFNQTDSVGVGNVGYVRAEQTFTLSATSTITGFSSQIMRVGSPASVLEVSIRQSQDGTVLLSTTVSSSTLTTSLATITKNFDSPASLSAGTYRIEYRTATTNASNHYEVNNNYPSGSCYSGGNNNYYNGAIWVGDSQDMAHIITYTETATSTATSTQTGVCAITTSTECLLALSTIQLNYDTNFWILEKEIAFDIIIIVLVAWATYKLLIS